MADGWMTIMQQTQGNTDDIRNYLASVTPPKMQKELSALSTPISEAEVTTTIKHCKRGKAQGPDELGNDWYRDNTAKLAPLFERLFNLSYSAGITPDSFTQANIHCIK